jgi:transcriptional regulator with XRE-family HTH domain
LRLTAPREYNTDRHGWKVDKPTGRGANRMPFPTVLREIRKQRKMSQAQVGRIGYVSEEMVGAVEAGRRRFTPDTMARIAEGLGEPQLYLEAAREVTGGVFTAPWLNGERVDLHRCSVAAKLNEELGEALAAVGTLDLVNRPRQDEPTRRQVREALLQVLDAHVAIDTYVAVITGEFHLSVSDLYAAHERKLREKGYLRREAPEKAKTRAAL